MNNKGKDSIEKKLKTPQYVYILTTIIKRDLLLRKKFTFSEICEELISNFQHVLLEVQKSGVFVCSLKYDIKLSNKPIAIEFLGAGLASNAKQNEPQHMFNQYLENTSSNEVEIVNIME